MTNFLILFPSRASELCCRVLLSPSARPRLVPTLGLLLEALPEPAAPGAGAGPRPPQGDAARAAPEPGPALAGKPPPRPGGGTGPPSARAAPGWTRLPASGGSWDGRRDGQRDGGWRGWMEPARPGHTPRSVQKRSKRPLSHCLPSREGSSVLLLGWYCRDARNFCASLPTVPHLTHFCTISGSRWKPSLLLTFLSFCSA